MPKKDQDKPRLTPTHEFAPDEKVREALGVDDGVVLDAKINQLANLLWRHEGESEEERHLRAVKALEHFNSLKPADGAEGMLAQQMVGTHFAALECLRRAAHPQQTFEGRDMGLKHAHKLMTLYARQLETLNKHRGKGQQKVTVEHVRVEKGGQAFVGNMESGDRGNNNAKPPELEHKPDSSVPLDLPQARKAEARKRK